MTGTYKPLKVGLFDNSKTRYTMAQVKALLGEDVVLFNGGLFDNLPKSKTYLEPCCDIKINGSVLADDRWGYEGMGWKNGQPPHYALTTDMPSLDNFFSCVWAITNGKKVDMIYPPDMGNLHGRTAWGVLANGDIYVLCTTNANGAMTIEQAQDKLFNAGCVIGVINDCGGSCQCITPTETIYSTRTVSNFVYIQLDKTTTEKPKEDDTLNIIQPNYKWAYGATVRKKTDYIVLHHVGAVGNFTPEQIHAEHLRKGWRGIGYNFYIRKDGTIYHGREENAAGGHTLNYNEVSIGICFEGNFEVEKMPLVQKEAGQALIAYLKPKYPTAKIVRHSQLNATACPGINFPFADIVNAPIVTAPTPTQPTEIIYRVIAQVGSFKDKPKAEAIKTELEAKGYKVTITEVKI